MPDADIDDMIGYDWDNMDISDMMKPKWPILPISIPLPRLNFGFTSLISLYALVCVCVCVI